MFGCLLRVSGKTLDLSDVLTAIKLPYSNVYRKGELRRRALKRSKLNRPNKSSGFSCVIGKSNDKTIRQYVKDAIRFLKTHKAALTKLSRRKDVEILTIDFGLESRISNKIAAQFDYIPPELVNLASKYKIGFEISNYSTQAFDRALKEAEMRLPGRKRR
jgi:hypothetical protein